MTTAYREFKDKTVWITGVNQGLGQCIAANFVEYGAKVIGIDQKFDSPSDQYHQLCVDIADSDAVSQQCQQLLDQGVDIDIFVSVAGIVQMTQLEDTSIDQWQRMLDVNVSGPFYLLKTLIPKMKQQKQGAIVTVSSNANHMARYGMSAYGASKAALTHLIKVAGLELAEHNIRANIVSPGSSQTPMQWQLWQQDQIKAEAQTIAGNQSQFKPGIPLNRLADPQDIANTVLFLASSQAKHITMQDIVVDGGATLGC